MMNNIAVKLMLFLACAALSVRGHAQEGDWSWTDQALRNAALYENIQSIAIQYEYAKISGEHLNQWSSDQWRAWWDRWPAGQDEITIAQLNEILLPEVDRRSYSLNQVQSFVQGDRGSAVLIGKFLPNAVSRRISENRHLRVERTEGPRQSHVVSASSYGGPGSWFYPITGREVFGPAIIFERLLPSLRTGRVSSRKSNAVEISRVEFPELPKKYALKPVTYVVDRSTGTVVEYLSPGSRQSFYADARQLSNGCTVPFRTLELQFSNADALNKITAVKVYVVRECLINQDFTKQSLHPAQANDGIFVESIPVKGGPWLLAETPLGDVLEFVEKQTQRTQAVISNGSSQWLMWAILAAMGALPLTAIFVLRRKHLSGGFSVP